MAVCTKCGQTTGELGRVLRESIALGAEVGAALLVFSQHFILRDERPRYSEDRGPVPARSVVVTTTDPTGATDGQ